MSHATPPPIRWTFDQANPVIPPGRLHGALDDRGASAAHVLQRRERYDLYYWATGTDGVKRICRAKSDVARPNEWRPMGAVLGPQPEAEYNCNGPSFPFVLPIEGGAWLMYFCGWGRKRADGKLPNTTGLALSRDGGATWRYAGEQPLLPLDRPWDCNGTGSCCVLRAGAEFRMYYTAIGEYFPRPPGVRTGHGEVIPRIGIGYAVSADGLRWSKPLDGPLIAPRGFDAEPYEYICSKPFVIREADGWRMWVGTFGHAYRIRSLTSLDGLHWAWVPSGPDGDLGVGAPGAFDDHQRSYACVCAHEGQYRCWYTGNSFGATGMGYAVGARQQPE